MPVVALVHTTVVALEARDHDFNIPQKTWRRGVGRGSNS